MLRHLHHLSFATRDLAASRAFYRDVLGFREVPRPPFNFEGAWLAAYGLQIHLIVSTEPDPSRPINSRGDHVAFEVADSAAIERHLIEQGIKHQIKTQAGTGVRQIFCRDPDGHTLEFAVYGPWPSGE